MTKHAVIVGATLLAAAAGAGADVYTDATRDLFDNTFTHMDIASVQVSNDATDLQIAIQFNGPINSPDWGKYGVLFDTRDGGSNNPSNGWGRNIQTANLNDFWIGSWMDSGGGAQVWEFDGASWVERTATYSGSQITMDMTNAASGLVTYSVDLATLGLGVGSTVLFDVVSTGGGNTDPGVDHLSRADMATPAWDQPSVAGTYLSYTVVPAPGAAALLGIAGLATARRRRH